MTRPFRFLAPMPRLAGSIRAWKIPHRLEVIAQVPAALAWLTLRDRAVRLGLAVEPAAVAQLAGRATRGMLVRLGAKLDDIGLWRKTGRAALYVMMAMALVSGFDYFRKFLKPLLAMERTEEP